MATKRKPKARKTVTIADDALMSVKDAAALLNLTPRRLQQLVADGWIKKDGQRYGIVATVHGYLAFIKDEERNKTTKASDARLKAVRAENLELQVEEKKRNLIPMDEALSFASQLCGEIRSAFGALPTRFTRDLELRKRLDDEVSKTMNRVAAKHEKLKVEIILDPKK